MAFIYWGSTLVAVGMAVGAGTDQEHQDSWVEASWCPRWQLWLNGDGDCVL